jgi:hypothetical protein
LIAARNIHFLTLLSCILLVASVTLRDAERKLSLYQRDSKSLKNTLKGAQLKKNP